MRKPLLAAMALTVVSMIYSFSWGEPPTGRDGPPRNARRRGGPPRSNFQRPPHPILAALDADRDGVLSADEIANAATALQQLDKNKDGKLSTRELRPQRGARDRARRGRGGADRFGQPPQGRGRRGKGGPGRGGPGRSGPGRGNLASRLMQHDQDGDGKVAKDELPERMQRKFNRADANGDGTIDQDEASQMAERFADRRAGGRGREGAKGRSRRPRPQRPNEE